MTRSLFWDTLYFFALLHTKSKFNTRDKYHVLTRDGDQFIIHFENNKDFFTFPDFGIYSFFEFTRLLLLHVANIFLTPKILTEMIVQK